MFCKLFAIHLLLERIEGKKIAHKLILLSTDSVLAFIVRSQFGAIHVIT